MRSDCVIDGSTVSDVDLSGRYWVEDCADMIECWYGRYKPEWLWSEE
jgi:hypothetical protein